jgi:hypothetical protein
MATAMRKFSIPKFPLRLMPEVRRTAEEFSAKEGVSLNQFINVAVAEKLAHLKHDEWAKSRQPATKELAEEAMQILEKGRSGPVVQGDELPEGYEALPRMTEGR